MAKKITLVKDRSLTQGKIMKLITDATEIKIQRPKRDCEKYGDLGYQGGPKIASKVILSIKKKKSATDLR